VSKDTGASIGFTPSRVVAGEDAAGRAVVLSKGTPDGRVSFRGVDIAELWRFGAPARHPTDGGEVDPDDWQMWAPTVGSMTWRVVRFTAADPTLHRTPTIDLVFVTDGEIDLVLEDGPTRLRAGDSAVIQGCMHGWQLVEDRPCTMVAVVITIDEISRA
jgi:hypothetical protein